MESQEEGVPGVGKAGKEVSWCAKHQQTYREYVLVHGVALEKEEAEHVRGHFVRAIILER